MQVTHENSNITHVAMGGLEAIECGITGDAHFMHMLSASLYKDQKLAMVREVVCNAWDAHIMVGKTDPIEVTINNDELVIRDFGPGIPHEKIGPIYGVYGASTKKNDGKQTGGFGLGCKSPWSYTDTFEVTSCHDGKMAIYQMTKSASEREGKPSIKPIVVNLPTTESGITVKINIKNYTDSGEIMSKLRHVLYYGGIPCLLNGALADTIDYGQMKTNWLVTNHREGYTGSNFLVRYGNVVYPITDHNEYKNELAAIHKFIKTLPTNTLRYVMVFQAPPDSLSPTPSREELSMIDMTVQTLKGLLKSFVDELTQDGPELTIERAMQRIRAAADKDLSKVMVWDQTIPKRIGEDLFVDSGYYRTSLARPVVELADLTDLSLDTTYPGTYIDGFRKLDLQERFRAIENKISHTWNMRLYKSYVETFHSSYEGLNKQQKQWFARNVSGWIVKKMLTRTKEMKLDNLYVLGQGQSGYWGRRNGARLERQLTHFQSFTSPIFFHMIPVLQYRVVLTHSRGNIVDRMTHHKDYRYGDQALGSMVYVIPRSPRMVQEAKDFFTGIGMEIIDMLAVHEWEHEVFKPVKRTPKDPAAPKVKRVKQTGLVRFDASIQNNHYHPQENARDNPNAPRIEEPLYFVTLQNKTRNGYDTSVGHFSTHASRLVAKLYGQYGAIAQKEAQIEKLRADGVKEVTEWVLNRVFMEMKTNKRIRAHIASSYKRLHRLPQFEDMSMAVMSFISGDPMLSTHFGMKDELTERDRLILTLYNDVATQVENKWGMFSYVNDSQARAKEWMKLRAVLDAIPPAPYLVSLAQKLEGNLAVELFNTSTANQILNNGKQSAERKALVRNLLIKAIG